MVIEASVTDISYLLYSGMSPIEILEIQAIVKAI